MSSEFDEWKRRAGNSMIQLAKELDQCSIWAPEGTDITMFENLSGYLKQEAENLFPKTGYDGPTVVRFKPRG